MAQNLLEKLIEDAKNTKATYVTIVLTENNVAYTSDGGSRKSTKNFKQTEKEIRAVEKVLKSFNEKNVLFSGNIKKISYTLSDGRSAAFERKDEGEVVKVKARRVTETNVKTYEFVRFLSVDNPYCGIAFSIKDEKNGRKRIEQCSGSVLNGIMLSGLDTDLQFVVSAPIKTNDGLLDNRYAKENSIAIKEVSTVLEMAMGKMMSLRLQGMSLFSVLPSTMDDDNELDLALMQAARTACGKHHLFNNRVGTIVNKHKIILGVEEVTKLFPQGLYEKVFGNSRYWIEPCAAGSRAEYFLIDIGIPYYDREKFIKELFEDYHFDGLMEVMASQKDKWLREFYIFCAQPTEEDITRRRMITGFKNMKSIRDSKGKMRYPYEVSIITEDGNTSRGSVVIKESILCPGGTEDEYTGLLGDFFINEIGIGAFSQKPEIEQLASDMASKKQSIDAKYCEKLMKLVSFDSENPGEIDFREYAVFPYEGSRGLSRAKAEDIVIGKPYVKEGSLISAAVDKPALWKGFKKLLCNEELEKLIEFAEKYGAVGMPKVIRQSSKEHANYKKELYSNGRRTNRDTDFDYSIPGLDSILKRRSLQLSKLVWQAINEVDNPEEVLYAEYSSDNRQTVKRCESSLIQILRQRTWVPDKDNKLHMPEDITIADISDELIYNRRNPILKQLQFGSGVKKKEQERKDLAKIAAREGLAIVPMEEYKEFLAWKNQKKGKKK